MPLLQTHRSLVPGLVRFLPPVPLASCSEPSITSLAPRSSASHGDESFPRPRSCPVFPVPPASCSEPSIMSLAPRSSLLHVDESFPGLIHFPPFPLLLALRCQSLCLPLSLLPCI